MSRRWIALAIAGSVIAGGCTPPPTPSTPGWATTRIARAATPAGVVNRMGAWTDDRWFATIDATTPPGGPTTSTLKFFPRTGPGGSVLGTPQALALPAIAGFPGPIGEHIVAVGDQTQRFYREAGGQWAEAGTAMIPLGFQPMALTDDWFGLRRVPGNPDVSGDGVAEIWSVDPSGTTVTVAPAATLHPDPAWPVALREGFGRDLAMDGDIAVVSASGMSAPAPGAARVFRASGGTWAPVLSLGGTVGDSGGFASSIAVHDGPTVDRIVVLTYDPTPVVRIYADSGTGFAVEQELRPDAPEPGITMDIFGAALAIDGDLLAVVGHATTVASAEPGHAPVKVGHVLMYRHGATWSREDEVATFPTPYDPHVVSAYPYRLQVAGDHVAVTELMSLDPPDGCSFPCFAIGFEAWSIDRR